MPVCLIISFKIYSNFLIVTLNRNHRHHHHYYYHHHYHRHHHHHHNLVYVCNVCWCDVNIISVCLSLCVSVCWCDDCYLSYPIITSSTALDASSLITSNIIIIISVSLSVSVCVDVMTVIYPIITSSTALDASSLITSNIINSSCSLRHAPPPAAALGAIASSVPTLWCDIILNTIFYFDINQLRINKKL